MVGQHTPVGGAGMLFIARSSKSARCECGCNVFTRLPDNSEGEHVWQCNGCPSKYVAG